MTRTEMLDCALMEILDAPDGADVFAVVRIDCALPEIFLVDRAVVLTGEDEVTVGEEWTDDDGHHSDEIPLPATTCAALRRQPSAGTHHVVLVGPGWTQFIEIEEHAFPPLSPVRPRGIA